LITIQSTGISQQLCILPVAAKYTLFTDFKNTIFCQSESLVAQVKQLPTDGLLTGISAITQGSTLEFDILH